MTKISICICTRNRQEGLNKLIDSLQSLKIPDNAEIKIVIVENDSENYSENIVERHSVGSKFSICYHLETRKGLAFARNRSVKEAGECDFCCFVDDDQIVASDWLIELLRCQREFDADGVWGDAPPVFLKKVPAYIRQFHTPKLLEYGTIVTHAGTGCLLMRKQYLDKIEGPFDVRLNFTGGEDILLTSKISKLGGIIRYNPKAVAYEIIPDNRTSIRYIAKRCYRNANTAYFVQSLTDDNFNKFNILLRLFLRMGLGLFTVIPYLVLGKSGRLKGLIKICKATGGFSFMLGNKNKFYN